MQGQGNDCMTTIQNWWVGVPFGVKFIFVSTTLLYLLDWPFNGLITYIFADIPILTFKGQLWRILFTQFVHGQIINLLISLLSIYGAASQLENTVGTVTFLIDMMIKNVLVQGLFLVLAEMLSFAFPRVLVFPSFGLWNLAMVYISLRSFSRPEEDTQVLCFPIMIKNKYYPIVLVVLFNLFNFPRLDILSAAVLAYIEYRYFNGMMFRPSSARVNQITNTLLFRNYSGRPDFVPYDGRLANDSGFQARPVNSPPQPQAQTSFKEFSGKAVKIGDAPALSHNVVYPTYPQAYNSYNQSDAPQTMDSQQSGAQALDVQAEEPQNVKPKNKQYNQIAEELV